METMAQLLVNGLIAGCVYALAAIGYSMVYSILKFANFANGATAMVGAYAAYLLYTRLGINILLAFVGSMLVTAVIGVVVDKVAYHPLRQAPKIRCLITAMAVSFIMEAAVLGTVGAEFHRFQLPVVMGWRLGPVFVTPIQTAMGAISVLFLLLLHFVLTTTQIGKAIRATADARELAEIYGVNTENVISAVFAIGSALAAASGTLIGLDTTISPSMGLGITVMGFAAVVLGGMGHLNGAILGSLILGLGQNLGVWFLVGGDTRWKGAIAYAILFGVLLVRPMGILGSKEDVRVF